MKSSRITSVALALAAFTFSTACSDSPTGGGDATHGTVAVRLTDAPFLTDSVKSVDIHVVRVEARVANADSAAADSAHDSGSQRGWITLASPNTAYDLLKLQNGVSTSLGDASLAAGTYNGLRFIIDPTKSSVTLKNGMKLSGTSSPSVTFPSASRSGIKVVLSKPLTVVGGTTTTLLLDFDVNESFVMRGNSIEKNGLLFKPVVKATVTDAATVSATVRLANATATGLTLLRSGTALTGSSDIAFGASSACASVPVSGSALSVVQTGSTTPLAGFAPSLTAGTSYTLIAYPNATGTTTFATVATTNTPATGQSGLRVFNATGTAYDVFVTAAGATLATPTVANTAAGGTSSFVNVTAGSQQVRLAAVGTTTALVDLSAQTFTAGQNATLVIAPPAAGSTTPRLFVVQGC